VVKDICGLKVSWPGKPNIESQRYSNAQYGIIRSTTAIHPTSDAVYSAACFVYDSNFLKTSSINDIYAFSKFSVLSSAGGPILKEAMIEHQGIAGRQIIVRKSKSWLGTVYARMFFLGETLYNLTLMVPEDSTVQNGQAWFDTVELPTA